MIYAILDIGANTVRLHLYECSKNTIKEIFSKKNVAGLVTYREDGKLSKKGIDKLVMVLSKYKKLISCYPVSNVYPFATASLRNLENTAEILKYVEKETGFKIELLNQKTEAALGFDGINQKIKLTSGITMDIGGGSSEITIFEDDRIARIYNLQEGCLSMYNKYVSNIVPTEDEFKNMKDYIDEKVCGFNADGFKINDVVGIGGTIRATGNILKELGLNTNKKLFESCQTKMIRNYIINKDHDVLKTILQVVPERIHTIFPGLAILESLSEKLNIDSIKVSDYGLREGYLLKKLQNTGKNQ